MTTLQGANALRLGSVTPDGVYAGSGKVWPTQSVSWGPEESLYPAGNSGANAPADGNTFTVGNQFRVLADGRITAIRYWSFGSPGWRRTCALWSDAGVLLGSALSPLDQPAGWVVVPITPVEVKAGTLYRASYSNSGGTFAYSQNAVPGSANLTQTQGAYSDAVPSGGEDDFPNNLIVPNQYFGDVVYQKKIAASFSPTDITGLLLWIDASQDMAIPEGTVASYVEHSPAHRVLVPYGSDLGPYFAPSVPTYVFDMYRSWYVDNFPMAGPGLTFAADNTIEPVNYPMLLVHGNDSNGYELRYGGSAYSNEVVLDYTSYGVVYSTSFADAAGTLTPRILRATFGGSSNIVGLDPDAPTVGGAPGASHGPGTMWIGRRQGGYNFRGWVSEALVYDHPITDAEMHALHAYMKAKWVWPR